MIWDKFSQNWNYFRLPARKKKKKKETKGKSVHRRNEHRKISDMQAMYYLYLTRELDA